MRVYGLTDLGNKIASTRDGSSEELRILHFIRELHQATNEDLERFNCDYHTFKDLVRRGLVKELTTRPPGG